jgi:hypothetical protein
VLTKDFKVNYYKDQALYKGTIQLYTVTKIVKKGADTFELVNPGRTYVLSEPKSAKSGTIDKWIKVLNESIGKLTTK